MFKTLLAASLTSLAAAPAPRAKVINTFSIITVHSGNENVHLRDLSFTEEKWWFGKNTTTYCPNTNYESSTLPSLLSRPIKSLRYSQAQTPQSYPTSHPPQTLLCMSSFKTDSSPTSNRIDKSDTPKLTACKQGDSPRQRAQRAKCQNKLIKEAHSLSKQKPLPLPLEYR